MTCNGKKECATLPELGFRFCIIGDELQRNEDLISSVEHYRLPIVFSSDAKEFINQGAEYNTIYILNEFEGDLFFNLNKAGQRVLGPTSVMQLAKKNEPLPNNIRPLYTTSMKNLVISFSGFRVKEQLTHMVALVHHMGGSIRKDFNMSKTTHLVATPAALNGEKYRYAVGLNVPIMTAEWIYKAWSRRHDVNCYATDEELMHFRLLPFVGCKLAFLGYQSQEKQHMIEIALKNGGEVVASKDPSCTHTVIEDGCMISSSDYAKNTFLLKNEWFWACIQIEAKADEGIYIYENPNAALTSSSLVMPIRGNKRKRLESVARQLILESLQENEIFCPESRKKSEAGKLSISGSFLDATMSPDKSIDTSSSEKETEKVKSPPFDLRSLSPRQQVCFELFQTENNYVGILHTIITVFKEPLENPDLIGGILLAPAEIKIIFGNLPPIYEIHLKIRNELSEIIHNWNEDHSIGNLILNHAHELMKSYPPFVNFFEKTKSLLATCDQTKPRFHAFLKRNQSKPECGRQTLQELLIRPVQRLPSIILLLNDILKHTSKNSSDFQALEKALMALKDVLMHINEDKRKTECQVEMFDIVNDIDSCPPNLLSSHRNLVSKVDTQEITDLLSKKSCTVSLFLFTDVLEICKRRGKATVNSIKSPGVASLTAASTKSQGKSYKHIDLIPLSHIKRVVDITETDDHRNIFAIVLWSSRELKELLYAFELLDEIDKNVFLRTFCRQIANSVCKADAENLLISLNPEQLDLQEAENSNALTKALNKTKCKLGRALSMKRTPAKRGLSRAVSTIISPLRNLGTPRNSMATLRLSSVTNLTEFVPPSPCLTPSPVPGKKMKSFSLGLSFGRFNV